MNSSLYTLYVHTVTQLCIKTYTLLHTNTHTYIHKIDDPKLPSIHSLDGVCCLLFQLGQTHYLGCWNGNKLEDPLSFCLVWNWYKITIITLPAPPRIGSIKCVDTPGGAPCTHHAAPGSPLHVSRIRARLTTKVEYPCFPDYHTIKTKNIYKGATNYLISRCNGSSSPFFKTSTNNISFIAKHFTKIFFEPFSGLKYTKA